jgi:hypothetical protein
MGWSSDASAAKGMAVTSANDIAERNVFIVISLHNPNRNGQLAGLDSTAPPAGV